MKLAQDALKAKRWNTKAKRETREEYAARMMEVAEEMQLELMLQGHTWKQHMSGLGNQEQTLDALDKHILEGGIL